MAQYPSSFVSENNPYSDELNHIQINTRSSQGSVISELLTQLDEEISILEKFQHDLKNRLIGVLRPVPSSDSKGTGEKPHKDSNSPLAESLHNSIIKVRILRERTVEIYNNLDV